MKPVKPVEPASGAIESLNTHPERPWEHGSLLLLFLWIIAASATLPILRATSYDGSVAPTVQTVDPNAAPWWELTILPRVGETIARRIVSFREQPRDHRSDVQADRVFRKAADLDQVGGIGPITVQRIARHLRFNAD